MIATIKAGPFANGLVIAPDRKRVYVSNGRGAAVQVIETASNTIVGTVAVGQRPWNMALTPDGRKLYVANGRSNTKASLSVLALDAVICESSLKRILA